MRHGQASFGSADYDVLSPSGEQQARRLGAALAERGIRPALVISGSMRRQRASAAALVGQAEWPLEVSVDAGWDEFELSGLVPPTSAGQQPRDREAYQDALEAGMHRWAGAVGAPLTGESFADLRGADRVGAQDGCRAAATGCDVPGRHQRGRYRLAGGEPAGAGVEQWIRLEQECA